MFCDLNIVNRKTKKNLKVFTKRRIILSLVFLVFAFGLFNFVSFSGSNKFSINVGGIGLVSAQSANTGGQKITIEDSLSADGRALLHRDDPGSPAQPAYKGLIEKGLSGVGAEIGDMLLWAFNAVLTAVFKLTVAIVYIAAKLFDWSVDAKIFGLVMRLDAIKMGWTIVRDFLNMFFILVLLFSAFCTILQIDKYNIKKILLNLVIMALLVNFSFPIARFIIDAANIPMYYFFNAIARSMGGNSISDVILRNSGVGNGLEDLMFPLAQGGIDIKNGGWMLTLNLIAAIIFTFIFGMTLLIIAALLLIRIVVLALLIIFAPIGFAASILPGTKLASFAGEWWDALFKQAFFGPIMAFVLYIAIFMMGQMADITKSLSGSANGVRGDILSSVISTGLALSFPIIILWVGIMMAQKGAIGASAVSKKVTGWGKWAGKKFSGYNFGKKQYDAYTAQRKKREDEKNKHRWGGTLGKKFNAVEDRLFGLVSPSARKRYKNMRTDDNNKSINDGAEDLIKGGTSAGTIIGKAGAAGSTFGQGTGKDEKVNDAKQARAYIKMDFNERRDLVDADVRGKAASTEVQKVINLTAADLGITDAIAAAAHAAEQAAVAAITTAATGAANDAEVARVNRFMNNQMNAVVRKGSNA